MSEQNQKLLARALDSAVRLDQQLNLLLDAYDFYSQRYGATHPAQMNDLMTSVKELGTLPRVIALNLTAWRQGIAPDLSREGFELNAINEMILHMNTMHRAFKAVQIDMGLFSPQLVGDCMKDLQVANNAFATAST